LLASYTAISFESILTSTGRSRGVLGRPIKLNQQS
jgi:hypothetical protein